MLTPSVCGRPNLSHGARAFTLVELVTAASIMTIIMIGVVEIFAVVTQTAAEAEAIHGAYQQMRATLDRLNRDLRGITREGPLQISAALPTGGDLKYHSDALAFVSVGRHFGAYDPENCQAGAAEILYTTRVRTPTDFLRIGTNPVDSRRGVLARSAWLMGGDPDTSATETQDNAKAPYLGDLYASLGGTAPLWVGRVSTEVTPFLPGDTGTPDASVRRVMTTGTSEFFVEYWDNASSKWTKGTKTFNPGDSDWPRAIRVTLAVHDPGDRGPPPADGRFKGYALQEVFWIGSR
ncbi:MAG: hypothetical protein WBD75_07930 [Phycisphaerae bacterium]